MRAADIIQAFPFLILIIAIVAVLGIGLTSVYIAVAIVAWVSYARLIRGEILVAKNQEYVDAARSLGGSDGRVIVRHLLPNVITSALVFATTDVVLYIVLVTSLSYLGLAARPPSPEWGAMITEGTDLYGQRLVDQSLSRASGRRDWYRLLDLWRRPGRRASGSPPLIPVQPGDIPINSGLDRPCPHLLVPRGQPGDRCVKCGRPAVRPFRRSTSSARFRNWCRTRHRRRSSVLRSDRHGGRRCQWWLGQEGRGSNPVQCHWLCRSYAGGVSAGAIGKSRESSTGSPWFKFESTPVCYRHASIAVITPVLPQVSRGYTPCKYWCGGPGLPISSSSAWWDQSAASAMRSRSVHRRRTTGAILRTIHPHIQNM